MSQQGRLYALRSVYFIGTTLSGYSSCSAANNNVAHTGQEMSAGPDGAFILTLSCLAGARGHFLALRTCLYIRTEIKMTLEPHELRFIVLKLHYLGGYSWMGFSPAEIDELSSRLRGPKSGYVYHELAGDCGLI